MKYLNLASILLSATLLNGCLEVEDDNQIIENKVTVKGVVVDAFDSALIENATITVFVGSTELISGFAVTAGEFELSDLPQHSDIEIVISSPDNAFLPRTFYIETEDSSKDGITDLGAFAVSEAVDVEIFVVNNESDTPFSELEFEAYSHSGTNSSAYKYKHVSTFDTERGAYSITLPKFINTSIHANLDLDKDGNNNFTPVFSDNLYFYGSDLYVHDANSKESITIYLDEVKLASDIEIRLSLVNESSQPLIGATFFVDESALPVTFDETDNQYVINTQINDTLNLYVPDFVSDDLHYQSSAITIDKLDNGNLRIDNNNSYYGLGYDIPHTAILDLVISPIEIDTETTVEVVVASEEINPDDSSFSVFYSQAINVETEDISLSNENGFTVIKGNDDENDFIFPGSTLITQGSSIPVTSTLSLNDTRLTITPSEPLIEGYSYYYEVVAVENKLTEEIADLWGDDLFFSVEKSDDLADTFSINDIKLDNENFTTNGTPFIEKNSAGISASPSDWITSVKMYLPTSIESLQNLTLRKVSITQDGYHSESIDDFNLIIDGEMFVYSVGVVNLAENENVTFEPYYQSVVTGSAQEETQKVYQHYIYEYLPDNTSVQENSITFEYSYETKQGETFAGNITIPVQ